MATGDRPPPGRANPYLTPSALPDTPTRSTGGPCPLRGDGAGNAAASPGLWPEQGRESKLSAVSVRRTGLPVAGKALKPV